MRTTLILSLFLFPVVSHAGLFELSATGNYRRSSVDATHYSIMSSGTGGLAYYFWELSAIEVSYTQGNAAAIQPDVSLYTSFQMYEANFLITFADKESAFRPYIKLGGGYTIRRISEEVPNTDPIVIKKEGFSPLAGIGFKLMLTQSFALKAGVDVYSSALNETPVLYDYSGYAGISILF